MKLLRNPLSILLLLSVLIVSACRAPVPGEELAFNWGTFGVADTEQLFVVGAEYRMNPVWKGVRPIIGLNELDDSAEYVYAGARYDWDVTDRWQLSPSFAPGIYSAETLDLGGPLEFRSGLDIGYRFHEDWKFAVGIYHLSNGGLYSRNGGSEAMLFSLTHTF